MVEEKNYSSITTKKTWFYPVPNKSKHQICLNYGDWDGCCLNCHEPWCFYSQNDETKDIMISDSWRHNTSQPTIIEEEKE